MTPEILEKLKNVLSQFLSSEKKVTFFAVVRREDAELWDIVLAGEKIDNQQNLEWAIGIINKTLDVAEIVIFSRLILLDSINPFIINLTGAFGVTGQGTVQLRNVRINDIFLADAYLLYSRRAQ